MYDLNQATDHVHNDSAVIDPNQNERIKLYSKVASRPYFNGDEQGMYHPFHHQVMKMRSNGMIDMFVENNVGFRVDPKTQTINAFANHLKNHVAHISSWLTGNKEEYIKGSTKTQIGKNATIEVGGNVTLVVNGNVDAKVKENATISVGKNVSVKGRDVDIVAEQTLHLDGRTILIGLDKVDDHNAARYRDYYEYDDQGRRIKRRGVIQSGKVWMG